MKLRASVLACVTAFLPLQNACAAEPGWPLRQALQAEARACLRFETAPGRQPQIDFGATSASFGGERVRVHLFVATLGYSRRLFVRAFRHERQAAWFEGMEGAFQHFGGVPREVLFDNARTLVDYHDAVSREVRFNDRLHASRCLIRARSSRTGPIDVSEFWPSTWTRPGRRPI